MPSSSLSLFLMAIVVAGGCQASTPSNRSLMVRSACDATKVAAEAAVWCAAGVATRSCCAALDVEHGCLCSAVSNASSVLLTLHATCGRAGIIKPCTGTATAGVPATSTPIDRRQVMKTPSTCDAPLIADTIVGTCHDETSPSDSCCISVMFAVDMRGCICAVAALDNGEDMLARQIIRLYRACGGFRRLPDSVSACESDAISVQALMDKDEKMLFRAQALDEKKLFIVEMIEAVEIIGGIGFLVYKLYTMFYNGAPAAV